MNGLGNEIVVVDMRHRPERLSQEDARRIASHEGQEVAATRFDQLMVLYDPPDGYLASHADRAAAGDPVAPVAQVAIFNADGSSAGACGNGMRCVGLAVAEAGGGHQQAFVTDAGLLKVTVTDADAITVDMGRPGLNWQDVPTRDPFYDTTRIELQIGPIDDPILHSPSVCSMGNPHAVFWVEDVEGYDLSRIGPLLEMHPMFPEGANITLAHVETPTRARIRTWERGAGLTQACGSAASATLVSAARTGRMDRAGAIVLPGGTLHIEWDDDDHVIMTGPAEAEYAGTITLAADGGVTIEITHREMTHRSRAGEQ